tara:strand:+ start:5241 stop:5825 length:585 start_codon:yes stop_codon:yes gene_type:complete
MVKEPRPGKVKTRLGSDIGMIEAAWWYRHQSLSLLRNVVHPKWETVIAVTPDIEGQKSKVWPPELKRISQGMFDLGEIMLKIIQRFRVGPICIIGSDIPDVSIEKIDRAFKVLMRNEFVIGPTLDGGFWLFGTRKIRTISKKTFQNVRWSSIYAYEDTVKTLETERWACCDILRDVDNITDYMAAQKKPRFVIT